MKIEYDPDSKKYLLDAKVTTKARVISALRAEGVTCRRADLLLHLCKLAAVVNRYMEALEREPPPEQITYDEFRRAFGNMLANALDKAEAHDRRILAAREKQKGQPLTIRESLEPASQQETRQSEPIADAGAKTEPPAAETAGIKLPPLTAPARLLTPGEESAKQTFLEMHLAAARAQQAKEGQKAKDSPSLPSPQHLNK